MGERERECVVVSEGFGWALQRGISSRRRRNKSGDGRVPPREDGAERGVEREGGREGTGNDDIQ